MYRNEYVYYHNRRDMSTNLGRTFSFVARGVIGSRYGFG